MFQHHPSVTISPFASEIIFGAKLLYTVYGQSKMKSLSVQQFMFTITRTTSNRRHQLVAVHVQLPKQSTAWFYCCYCCYLFVCSPVIIRLLFWVTTYLYLVMFTNPTLNKASKKHPPLSPDITCQILFSRIEQMTLHYELHSTFCSWI